MTDDTGPALPTSLEVAWGRRERPSKGPRRGLSLGQIVAAAIRVGAADGFGAVSMARVAAELDAGTMALYRYVGSKSELIDLMVDTAFGPPPPLPAATGPAATGPAESAPAETGPAEPEPAIWRSALSHWAWAQLEAMMAQAWAVLAPISGPPVGPNTVAWIEQGLQGLRGTGLSESQKMSVILLVTSYVRNQVVLYAQISEALRAKGSTDQQMMLDYGRALSALIDPQRFPELTIVVASGVLSKADEMTEEFTFGLERILDGIAVLVDSLASPG
jgi:AcrR family transcriptional regulator